MIFREEYMEKVVRPKILSAAETKPKSLYDVCACLGLPPNSVHTVSGWLHELNIPVGEVCELSLRARRMMEARGFGVAKSSTAEEAVKEGEDTTSTHTGKKGKSGKSKGLRSTFKKKKVKTKGKFKRHI